MGAIIVKVGTETKKIAIDIPPNYNPHRFNDAGTVRGCRLVRPGMFNATPVHTMVDGRVMALAGNAPEDTDTYVYGTYAPDTNFSTAVYIYTVSAYPVSPLGVLTYIKCPPNKILHLFCYQRYRPGPIEVHEVNPADFLISTITFNTQPALGSVIYTYTPTEVNVWDEIPTGTSGAICIRAITSSLNTQRNWFSSNYLTDITKRPYFTDP